MKKIIDFLDSRVKVFVFFSTLIEFDLMDLLVNVKWQTEVQGNLFLYWILIFFFAFLQY
jgi:hypothetical protein